MKLVLSYIQIWEDNDILIHNPFEYESIEKALKDLKVLTLKAQLDDQNFWIAYHNGRQPDKKPDAWFNFSDHIYTYYEFIKDNDFNPPKIRTLENWFEEYKSE